MSSRVCWFFCRFPKRGASHHLPLFSAPLGGIIGRQVSKLHRFNRMQQIPQCRFLVPTCVWLSSTRETVLLQPHFPPPSLEQMEAAPTPVYLATRCLVHCLLRGPFPAAGTDTAGFIYQVWLIRSGIAPTASLLPLPPTHTLSLLLPSDFTNKSSCRLRKEMQIGQAACHLPQYSQVLRWQKKHLLQ